MMWLLPDGIGESVVFFGGIALIILVLLANCEQNEKLLRMCLADGNTEFWCRAMIRR